MKHQPIFVFLGPSLALQEANVLFPEAIYLPPVKCGDILRVMRFRPKAIVIIDGFFERTASVWHKEILHALSKGIKVYGAASMGALRGAELHVFGMRGVGRVFELFNSGELKDDDEVAVLHQDARHSYEPITEAMVNLRFTIDHAVEEKIVTKETGKAILALAKNIHYRTRTMPVLMKYLQREGVSPEEIRKFENFLKQGGYIDQKQEDARSVLEVARKEHKQASGQPSHKFSETAYLRTLRLRIATEPFLYYGKWLPFREQVVMVSRFLGEYYIATKRLARMLSIVYAIVPKQTSSNGLSVQPELWSFLAAESSASDAESSEWEDFLVRANTLVQGVRYSEEVPMDSEVREAFLSFMRLSGDYLAFRAAVSLEGKSREAIQLAVMDGLKQSDPLKYRLLLWTAYCWTTIERCCGEEGLLPTEATLEQNINLFRYNQGIRSQEQMTQWLQQRDMTQRDFIALVIMATLFDYLVKNNNTDIIKGWSSGDSVWWLLDALYLSGAYLQARNLLLSPETFSHELECFFRFLDRQGTPSLEGLDFPDGIDSVHQFLDQLGVVREVAACQEVEEEKQ